MVADRAGLRGPLLGRLWQEFYDGPSFTTEEACRLADELKALLEVLESQPDLVPAAWAAQPQAYRNQCQRPRAQDLATKCEALISVCEDAAREGRPLRSLSD